MLSKLHMHGLKKDLDPTVLPGISSGGFLFHMKNIKTRLDKI